MGGYHTEFALEASKTIKIRLSSINFNDGILKKSTEEEMDEARTTFITNS
jgi:hypothetical protein